MPGTYQAAAEIGHRADDEPLVLTPAQASKKLKISLRILRRYTKDGIIPCKRMGRSVRYPSAEDQTKRLGSN